MNQLNKNNRIDDPKSELYSQHEQEMIRNEQGVILSERDTLIQETKEMIEQEKKQWEEEKKQWIETAKAEGFQTGISLGKEEGLQQYRQLLNEANDLTVLALKDYHTTLEKHSEKILDLAIHTAEKILNQQLTTEPDIFISIVKSAIKEIKDQPIISIYLHSSNYQTVLQQKEELVQLLENEAKLAVYIRESITVNSCLIEHPYGQIDASVDTQLQQIRSVIHEVVAESVQ
jgi:flagellar assembly protein FliH